MAVTETNQGRCSNSTGTQHKYPVPIESGAGECDINEDGCSLLRHSPMAQNEINERHWSLSLIFHSELHWWNDRLFGS
jgi:hypothetical protein